MIDRSHRVTVPFAPFATIRRIALAMSLVATASLYGRAASGQQPTPSTQPPRPSQGRRAETTIEIRGQVPTPQVVTVRPREAPAYSRRVLVPAFFDHDFWPSILPPLQLVAPSGRPRADTTGRATADSASRALPVAPRPPSGTPPALLRR